VADFRYYEKVSLRNPLAKPAQHQGTLGMKRPVLWQFALPALLLLGSTIACGGDTSMLRPPKGSKVAIVVFEDLECPDCARAAPLLHDASKTYNIPLVQYDFPLPQHPWSFEAAVNARYFDTKSKKIGDDYRLYIFQNQPYITKQNLRGYTEKFAEQNKVALPFVVDPSGEFAAKVKADYQLGQRLPVDHTPTIYVVSNTARGTPFVEVVDRTQLYHLIEQVMKDAGENPQEHKSASAQKASRTQ
jgi:protein-disulfide isomerase